MLIGFNEIQRRAIAFAKDWEDASDERAEAQLFWRDLLAVFGVNVRAVGRFEARVRNLRGNYSRIDLFWPSVLLAEHKSRGEDLGRAHAQAEQYIIDLQTEDRGEELPRYLLVSDFESIVVHDLDTDRRVDVKVAELHRHIRDLEFIAGIDRKPADPEDPVNIEAAERLAKLKDALEEGGYPAHDLERFMVRILFCLFAEDTGLLGEPDAFRFYIENVTKEDGSDLGLHIAHWFEVLDQPIDTRSSNLDAQLAELRYVNGELFSGRLPFATFNRAMRDRLLACCSFNWSQISPAVFGSLFQSIMTKKERRQIGAHYTTERDILKVIRSLFLDELHERFERIKHNKTELKKFHAELGRIKVLDPACGCGNFLVIAYRELRRLEIKVLKVLHPKSSAEGGLFNIPSEMVIDVDQMYGIEIEEWPAQIATVALWLVDHQMNVELSEAFGDAVVRLPLTHSAHIVNANALRVDWSEALPAAECTYVLGNPPFRGKSERTSSQKEDMKLVWRSTKGASDLDYVTCWYVKAAEYLLGRPVRSAFVSTNSITQGEQPSILWAGLHQQYGLKIDFAHRTFPWESEARGKAHVHVVIIGFSSGLKVKGEIHDYDMKGNYIGVAQVKSISPYLAEGPMRACPGRSSPMDASAPRSIYGSMQNDGGFLVLNASEREELLSAVPSAAEYVREFHGAKSLINNKPRWCLWLVDAEPAFIRGYAEIRERVEGVRNHRLKSSREATRRLASTPSLFGENRQLSSTYLAIPRSSSSNREYIPLLFLEPHVISNTDVIMIPEAGKYIFGVLHSAMHMAWVRHVCGRLKSDYRYSVEVVYNNFPWPQRVTDKRRTAVELAGQAVLDVRKSFPSSSLADLYDPLVMPKSLRQAHVKLDRAVDLCYRSQPFPDERRRFEYLFSLWESLENPLTRPTKKGPSRGRKKTQA